MSLVTRDIIHLSPKVVYTLPQFGVASLLLLKITYIRNQEP